MGGLFKEAQEVRFGDFKVETLNRYTFRVLDSVTPRPGRTSSQPT